MEKQSASFCVIGSGMSGLVMAIRLKKAGFSNITILEKTPTLGGTWYHNQYPGVACDVPAHYYSYSFFLNPNWSRKFAPGAEIYQYFERVVQHYDLRKLIQFNSEAESTKFDGKQWHITTKANGRQGAKTYTADFLISASGILHKPVFPKIEGIDQFKGDLFHSAQWDKKVSLKGKRVAVIGNGSTGVQMIPRLAEQVEHLVSFQRSAQWIMPAKDKVYSPLFKALNKYLPGFNRFQYWSNRKTFEVFTNLVLEEGWQRNLVHKMTRASLNTVKDPVLKEKLRPDYEPGCKRLVMSNEYYRALQKDNVEVDVAGIHSISEKGILTGDGRHLEFDIIVIATGFDPRAYMRPMTMENEKGETLDELWAANGAKAYHTVALPDFANYFMVLGPNSPVGNFSVIAAAEDQTNYIVQCIKQKIKQGTDAIKVSQEATETYNEEIKSAMKSTIWLSGCKSWYLDAQGNSATWPWTPKKFRADLKKPDFSDFEFFECEGGIEMERGAEERVAS